jgi:hypothetical protein
MSRLAGPTVEVLYSCCGCGLKNRSVELRERITDERLTDWIRLAQGVVTADHAVLRPECTHDAFDLMVHAQPGAHIGRAVRQ